MFGHDARIARQIQRVQVMPAQRRAQLAARGVGAQTVVAYRRPHKERIDTDAPVRTVIESILNITSESCGFYDRARINNVTAIVVPENAIIQDDEAVNIRTCHRLGLVADKGAVVGSEIVASAVIDGTAGRRSASLSHIAAKQGVAEEERSAAVCIDAGPGDFTSPYATVVADDTVHQVEVGPTTYSSSPL